LAHLNVPILGWVFWGMGPRIDKCVGDLREDVGVVVEAEAIGEMDDLGDGVGREEVGDLSELGVGARAKVVVEGFKGSCHQLLR
jgi:hypothetical protein